MRLDVVFRNIEHTDALKERADKKFAKVARYLKEPVEGHLVLWVQRHRHVAELTVTAAGEVFRAQEESDDMYSSIDAVNNTLERTVRRRKERVVDLHHAGPPVEIDGFGGVDASDAPTEEIEEDSARSA